MKEYLLGLLKKSWFQKLVTFSISIVFLFFAVQSVDLQQALQYAGSFDVWLMLSGLLIWLVGYYVRAIRWNIFLNNISKVRLNTAFKVLMAGFAMNNLLPLRAGEFVRAYLLHRNVPKIKTSAAFATVAGERVFDGVAVVLVTYIGAYSISLPEWSQQAIQWSAGLFATALVMFFIMVLYPAFFTRLVQFFTKFLPSGIEKFILAVLEKFIVGLSVLRSHQSVFVIFFLSICVWLMEVAFYYFSALSFGIDVSFLNACFLMGILNLAIMIPAGPGGVGTFEFVTVRSLLLLGVTESLSFSYGVVSHVVQNGSVIVIGLFYLWSMGFSNFSAFKDKAK